MEILILFSVIASTMSSSCIIGAYLGFELYLGFEDQKYQIISPGWMPKSHVISKNCVANVLFTLLLLPALSVKTKARTKSSKTE